MTAIANHSLTIPPSKKAKPSARTKKRLAQAEPSAFIIDNLAHDGRGVATYGTDPTHLPEKNGKKVFIHFALPNETVLTKITNSKKGFEEGDALSVLKNPHPERQKPICAHFGICGGCSLQHWQADGQINFKQSILAELLKHHANTQPENWLPPLIGERLGYRTKARMGVRFVEKKDTALVGFRERNSNFLADLNECHILDVRIGQHILALKQLISTLDAKYDIAQLEVAIGEHLPSIKQSQKSVAVIVRHMSPLSEQDLAKLQIFFAKRQWQLYLQPKGVDTVHRIDDLNAHPNSLTIPPNGGLFYHLPDFDITFEFSPLDFTQVNLSVNRQMTKLACDLLDLKKGERVLDLFCGLGNFSLPMAKMVGATGFVIGVEGSQTMTKRAKMNADANHLYHTQFFAQDLTQDFSDKEWLGQVDALLIDPPRSGAWEVMTYLPKFNAKRIVYVSCNPITLARDSKALIEAGYRLTHAGVMDMFCHTGHVESIARFEKCTP